MLRSLRENGVYVFGSQVIGRIFSVIRNTLIARHLGVKKITIGPRSYLRGLSSISMGDDISVGEGFWLEAIRRYNDQVFSPRISIGNHVCISRGVHIAATHFVEIGENVLIGSKVIITDHNHGQYSREHTSPKIAPALRPLDHNRRVVIGRNVWLSDGVVVTPGSSIGEGAVIGANSVVRGNIPPFTIAAGVPAKVFRIYDFDAKKWIKVE